MNSLQCAFFESGFRRHRSSKKLDDLKSIRANSSVILARVRIEAKKVSPSLAVIAELRRHMCDVVAFSYGKNIEVNPFFKNCAVYVWFVMSGVAKANSDREKLTLLTTLHGVGVKTATFILSVFYPTQWGYITDPSVFYSAHLGFVHWEKTYFQIISVDDAIAVNGALVKISKEVGIQVADLSCVMFVIFFYGYKNGFRSGTGKKYGGSYE